MSTNQTQDVKVVNADPSSLGLFGLAMVTAVASSQKLGLTEGVSFVLPWAIFLGGFAQLFACINDSKGKMSLEQQPSGDMPSFSFGVGASWMIKAGVLGQGLASSVDTRQLGVAYLGYLIFTIFMTIGAMETHKVLFTIFFPDRLPVPRIVDELLWYNAQFSHKLAAYSELLISLFSFYGSAAAVLNAHFGRVFLPVGKPFGIFKK